MNEASATVDTTSSLVERAEEGLTIVSREEWGAASPALGCTYPALPSFIRFLHTGNFDACMDRESCIKELRALQKKHMDEGHPDIKYNFLVGDEGTIYEGRGWKTDIELSEEFREVQGKTVDIAYMGYYKYEMPPHKLMLAAFNLLIHGINKKAISPFFDFQHLMP